METGKDYVTHLNAMKNYQISQGRQDYQAPYHEAFEEIYERTSQDVDLSNAKEILSSLSESELKTVQKYNGLAEAVDVGAISSEGAYNLLMHDNEQYDFDNDGTMEVGAGKMLMSVPRNMPGDVKEAYIEAMNSLEGKEKLMAMMLTFDVGRVMSHINNTPYTPPTIDYEYLQNRVNELLNPKPPAFTSEETKKSIEKFWDAFQNSYTGSKELSQEEESDPAVEEFLDKLHRLGASKFLADFNKEKIDEEVEKFKQELMKNMDENNLNMQDIEKLVNNFKKQLMEKYEAIAKNSDKPLDNTSEALIKSILEMKNMFSKPLNMLLKESA